MIHMRGIVVALPNDKELAASVGKGGTESSMLFYNRKVEDDTVTVLTPTDTEKRYYAVPESILLADVIVLGTAHVDALLGETLIAAGMVDKPVILTDENDVSRFTKDAGISKISIVKREALLQEIRRVGPVGSQGDVRIDIDAAFNVKGVGTVLLGIVRNGTVRTHDTLVHSGGKQVMIRSIQSLDVDIESAVKGIRVGLAVKGLESDEVEKGDILAMQQAPRINFSVLNSDQIGTLPSGKSAIVKFSDFAAGGIPSNPTSSTVFIGYVWLGYCTTICTSPTNYTKVATIQLSSGAG